MDGCLLHGRQAGLVVDRGGLGHVAVLISSMPDIDDLAIVFVGQEVPP